jgi:hypothetical protein
MACESFAWRGHFLLLSMEAGMFFSLPSLVSFHFGLSYIWRVYTETRNRMSRKDMEQIPQVVKIPKIEYQACLNLTTLAVVSVSRDVCVPLFSCVHCTYHMHLYAGTYRMYAVQEDHD